jgi:hypothetical protein
MDLEEVVWEVEGRKHVAQDRHYWQALVNMATNFWI